MSSPPQPPAVNGPTKEPGDIIKRGVYKPNPLGTATFIGLRALDPLLQYQLLAGGWGEALLAQLGVSSIPLHGRAASSSYGSYSGLHNAAAAASGTLTTLPLPHLIVLGMATGSALKQIYWQAFISNEELEPGTAVEVSAFNSFVNTLDSLLLLAVSTSSSLATPRVSVPGSSSLMLSLPTVVGAVLYVAGMALETASEVQRKRFKDVPANAGKVCTEGLWGMARHVNYGGYTLWRTGYALAAGGWTAGLLMAAFHVNHFASQSVKLMDGYMTKKYAEQWDRYKTDVPWKLIPFLY